MTDLEIIAVKQVLDSPGWEVIEALLLKEANKKFAIEGDYATIAVKAIAQDKLIKTLDSFLKTLNNIKNEIKTESVVYK